ncbi:MAG: alpha/beta hydrolase [Ilumatobacteraceae bacterium]
MAQPFVVPETDSWHEGDLHVALALPQWSQGPVPAVLLLDGQTMFLSAVEFARTVNLVTLGALPAMAVIGVWRDAATPPDYFATRFRDFTPYEWVLPGPFADDNAMATYGTGGAAQFLDLLVDRVLPAVRSRAEITDVAIGGWSLSGLFATWAWRERPDAFRHLLAISPSYWWHHGRIVDEGIPERDGARAFISAGEHEEGDVSHVWPQVFANAPQREMAAMVRYASAYAQRCSGAGVDTELVVFPDEHHVTVMPASLSRGLRHLFATR